MQHPILYWTRQDERHGNNISLLQPINYKQQAHQMRLDFSLKSWKRNFNPVLSINPRLSNPALQKECFPNPLTLFQISMCEEAHNNIWKKNPETDEFGQTFKADQSDCFFPFYSQASQLVAAQGFQLCQSQSSKAKISFPLAKASSAFFLFFSKCENIIQLR